MSELGAIKGATLGKKLVDTLNYVYMYMVVVSSNPAHGEVYSIQHCVIEFVSDLWQVGGFLRPVQVLRFPPPIKVTATI
jgi:hypothetical protein